MMGLIKFRVEPEISFLMKDEEFRRRVVNAYMQQQVEKNHGWGFTVRYAGYRIRFDIDDKASTAAVTVYKGISLEEPRTVQTKLTEVLKP
ncbi:MAG: hypothetical protein ACPL0C_02880 [Candidatus Bathyarchaeales archaeon]